MRRTAISLAVPVAILVAATLDIAVAFAQATSTTDAQLPTSTASLATQLTVTPGCLNKKPFIDISWQTAPVVMDFALLKAPAPGTPKAFKTFTNGTTTYHDTAVTPNKTYDYLVTASYLNWTGTSAEVSGTTAAKC